MDGVNIPGGPAFIGFPQPPDVPCDPTGDGWRGPPGPPGPPMGSFVSDTAPLNPVSGQLWFDSSNPQLYVWFVDPTSAQWVIATAYAGGLTTDAPSDGQTYGRQNGAWANIAGSGGYLPLIGGDVTGRTTFAAGIQVTQTANWVGGVTNDPHRMALYANNTITGDYNGPGFFPVTGYFAISSLNIRAPLALVNGLTVAVNTGMPLTTDQSLNRSAAGVWEALDLELNDTGPTNDFHTGTGGAWVALNIARRANANQGGTALTPDGTFGQNWGIDIVNVASGNATFLALQNGIEINMACTGNPTGDDVQTASFTGSISGQTLTITAISSGTPGPNMLINGTGVSPAVIVAQLTGTTGGVGTYSINGHAQTAASTALTGSNPTASVLRRAGIQISQSQGHSRRGTMWDNAFLLSAGLGAAPWRNGITVGSVLASQSPLTSDSKVFTYELAQDLTGSANIGIEMNDITFTTASIQLPGFRVDPIGATRIGTTYLTPSATGLAVDTKGSTTTGTPTISNAGSGYPTSGVGANVIADDAYGGVYTLQTSTTSDPVPGIIKAIEAVIRRPIYNGLTPPATLAVTGRAPSLGTGCVLGVTWNTAATTLALQPSGGNISSAPLTNAANDAAAAAAGVPLNGWYRNGSVMMQRVA